MKILLVQCPMAHIDAPPLGLASLATFLAKKKKQVMIEDINVEIYNEQPEENKQYWSPLYSYNWCREEVHNTNLKFLSTYYEKYIEKILSLKPDLVGFAFQTTNFIFVRKIIEELKRRNPNLFIVLGGPSVYNKLPRSKDTFVFEWGVEEYADALVIGESELTFLDIINQLEIKGKVDICEGSYIKKDNKWEYHGLRKPIQNLDLLPFPDYSFFPLDKYPKNKIRIVGSRGCYAKCVFCTDTVIWQYHRFRSAKDIFLEMRLRKAQGYSFVEFNDSTLNGNLKILEELCDLLIESDLQIGWGGSARIRPDMSIDLLTKMKRAGCSFLSVGIESGSQKVLDSMKKNILLEDAINFMKNAKNCRINITVNWIVGFPTETEEDFQKTVEFIKKYRYLMIECAVSTYHVNPYSYIEQYPEEFGIDYDIKKNWWKLDGSLSLSKIDKRYNKIMDVLKKLNQNVNFCAPP